MQLGKCTYRPYACFQSYLLTRRQFRHKTSTWSIVGKCAHGCILAIRNTPSFLWRLSFAVRNCIAKPGKWTRHEIRIAFFAADKSSMQRVPLIKTSKSNLAPRHSTLHRDQKAQKWDEFSLISSATWPEKWWKTKSASLQKWRSETLNHDAKEKEREKRVAKAVADRKSAPNYGVITVK